MQKALFEHKYPYFLKVRPHGAKKLQVSWMDVPGPFPLRSMKFYLLIYTARTTVRSSLVWSYGKVSWYIWTMQICNIGQHTFILLLRRYSIDWQGLQNKNISLPAPLASNDLRFLMILNILMNQFFEEYWILNILMNQFFGDYWILNILMNRFFEKYWILNILMNRYFEE